MTKRRVVGNWEKHNKSDLGFAPMKFPALAGW